MTNSPYYISEHFSQIMSDVQTLFPNNSVHSQSMAGSPGSESDIQIEGYFDDNCDLFVSHDMNSEFPLDENYEAPDGYADIVLWCSQSPDHGLGMTDCQQNWPGHRIALSDLTPEWIQTQARRLIHNENYHDASGDSDPQVTHCPICGAPYNDPSWLHCDTCGTHPGLSEV